MYGEDITSRNNNLHTFLNAHNTMSRIDYVLIPSHQAHSVKHIQLLARGGISDHSPILYQIVVGEPVVGRVAPINPWHLRVSHTRAALTRDTNLYFKENEGSVSSPSVLWEAYKAVIRGVILAQISGQRKEKNATLTILEKQILQLEITLRAHNTAECRQNLALKIKEFTDVATDAAKTQYRATQSRIYDVGDKTSKLLAWLDWRAQAQRVVAEIETDSGTTLVDHQDIVNEFGRYYASLYSSQTINPEEEALSLLEHMPLPVLAEEERIDLGLEITEAEVEKAIHALNSGRASGPNGLPIEMFKLTASKIVPPLTKMFVDSRSVGLRPEDQRLANIVIHKEGKPRNKCPSYQPISLLNCEAKILAKVLVTRLLRVISRMVHPDQSGFMPARNTSLNLRRLHGVLARVPTIREDVVVVSLDAASAFDTIEWSCMFAVLQKNGLWPDLYQQDTSLI